MWIPTGKTQILCQLPQSTQDIVNGGRESVSEWGVTHKLKRRSVSENNNTNPNNYDYYYSILIPLISFAGRFSFCLTLDTMMSERTRNGNQKLAVAHANVCDPMVQIQSPRCLMLFPGFPPRPGGNWEFGDLELGN